MIKILFVCMGNICRSPSAEGIMKKIIKKEGLHEKIKCDSAGTIDYHEGESADPRMIEHAEKRDYQLDSIARQIIYEDLIDFDYIITMDRENYNDVISLDLSGKNNHKVSLMTDYCSKCKDKDVPDPYYSGREGFELVLNILEDSCWGLLKHLRSKHSL
ncbi:low molecular weight protein-tyrosine-phosphatase [Bacteroidota bacterium]